MFEGPLTSFRRSLTTTAMNKGTLSESRSASHTLGQQGQPRRVPPRWGRVVAEIKDHLTSGPKEHHIVRFGRTPWLARTEMALIVLFCLIDDAYANLTTREGGATNP